MKKENEFVSECCKAEIERRGGKTDGSTFWFGCKKCKKDCDIIGKVMIKEKEESLSDFIEEDMYIGRPEDKEEVEKSGELLSVPVNKAKEKIQNAQRRLKEEIKPKYPYLDEVNLFIRELKEKIDKIFLEEIGRKLMK